MTFVCGMLLLSLLVSLVSLVRIVEVNRLLENWQPTFPLLDEIKDRIASLRVSLETILVVVVLLSLLLLWLSEIALKPLGDLTLLVQEITRRGLRKEDKLLVPEMSFSRMNEVSQLSREFYHMATALLEREKTVDAQKNRLQEQNRLLREMGELQQRLRQSEHLAAIGRMSAQVAHEVRNPLHAIGLEAEVAVEMAMHLGNTPLQQSLHTILTSVDRLDKITENYLRLSKLSEGQKSKLNLENILNVVLKTYAPECEKQGIKIHCIREPLTHFFVLGDGDLLQQVLGNLFRNSLQILKEFCISLPQISWTLGSSQKNNIFLRIEDNGPGVVPKMKSRLFTPFMTTRAQGTGLGLSFVKKIVEEHGGSICYFESKLGGACFEIILPTFDLSLDVHTEVRGLGYA